MIFDQLFTIRNSFAMILVIIVIKIIHWLMDYSYRVWVYSHVPGPLNIPFVGNVFLFLGEHSGRFI